MEKLRNLPYYNFSSGNKYSANYVNAYGRAVDAQNNIKRLKHSPNASSTELEKFNQELKLWEKKVEDYSILAKREEKSIEEQQKNGLGLNLNILA